MTERLYIVLYFILITRCNVELRLGNVTLKQVSCCKYLGIIIDNKLTWLEHINCIYNKILKFTSIFYKIRHILPYKVLITIYFTFVHSHFLYGIEIYGNTHRGYLNKLMVLNNKLLRILQNAPRNTPVSVLYKNFNTLTIPDLHIFQILVLIHKFFYHKEKLPFIFTSYFNENFLFHNYDTRNRDNLHVVRCNTSYGSKSVKFKGSNLWNQLPSDLKLITSLNFFKSKLKLTLTTSHHYLPVFNHSSFPGPFCSSLFVCTIQFLYCLHLPVFFVCYYYPS